MKKVAFVTGVAGQDGSYLAELLIEKDYEVHGMIRRTSLFTTDRIDHLLHNKGFHTHFGDLTDTTALISLLSKIKPMEIYNLGAQSHVAVSFELPEYTANVDGLGTLKLLEAVRICCPDARIYQASTSELFGGIPETTPQSELTPMTPRSPYAVAKLYSFWLIKNYREAYDMFACNGILFNHESPRRGPTFVTRKITRAVAEIALGKKNSLQLGNLNACRDWGHARDFVEGMWLILQHEKPDDFVLATGVYHTVRDLVEAAFKTVKIQIKWQGSGLQETGVCEETGRVLVTVAERYFRPTEVEHLLGNPSKAHEILGWKAKIKFDELVSEMVTSDLLMMKSDSEARY